MTDESLIVFPEPGEAQSFAEQQLRAASGQFESSIETGETSAFLEPISASWIALQLASGVLAHIGGSVFARIFGSGEEDIATLLRDVVDAVRQVVKAAIQENELRKLGADLSQLQSDLIHYLNSPAGRDRLESATENASRTVAQLASFGLAGHAGYLTGLSTHLVVIQERIKIYGRAESLNLLEIARRGISHAEKMQADWITWHANRYEIRRIKLPNGVTLYVVRRDGKTHAQEVREDKARESLERNRTRHWDRIIYPNFVKPSEDVVAEWKKLLPAI